jgi:SAM-dependent methyltransferase
MSDTTVDWNSAYLRNSIPWEKGEAAPPLLEYLEGAELKGRVFVPGCGLGHDVRALAEAGAEPLGFDISAKAVELADGYTKTGSETYVVGDLFNLPEEMCGAFDWVFEHTCLSALAPTMRAAYIDAYHKALKPGGKVLAIFFINPWDWNEMPEPPPYGISVEDIDAMIAGRFRVEEEWRPTRQYPGREGRELMRVLTRV